MLLTKVLLCAGLSVLVAGACDAKDEELKDPEKKKGHHAMPKKGAGGNKKPGAAAGAGVNPKKADKGSREAEKWLARLNGKA